MNKYPLIGKWLVIGIVFLFFGTSLIASKESSKATPVLKKSITETCESRDQIELKYYAPETLHNYYPGFEWPPHVWKEGIRLTQTELDKYSTWNLTQVIIGFADYTVEGPMRIRIYIYDKGDATHPGNIIENDTTITLNYTGLVSVPLVTPVPLAGHDEIWIAVEWNQTYWIQPYYTFWDVGPAVRGKGDWIYEYNQWQEGYNAFLDSNWALGAIVEGQGYATLEIGNVKGPIGINTEVQNIGNVNAFNVSWTIFVRGGILNRVNETVTGTLPVLVGHETLLINIPMFIGLGKIAIEIQASATNAPVIKTVKLAFLLGPFVIRIR